MNAVYVRSSDRTGVSGRGTGTSVGLAVIPAIVGSSVKAARLSMEMLERGINVQPIVHPAVAEKSARLRFFISSEHSEEEVEHTVKTLSALM